MKTKIDPDYDRLYWSILLSVCYVSLGFFGAYLTHLLLSMVFGSVAVFSLFFGLAVGLGVWHFHGLQKRPPPRIAIRRIEEP